MPQLKATSFYTSHEALLLPYEQALTRQDSLTGDWYDTSAHMLWIGDRTRFDGSAHVEFLRGIGNPIGIKCGPSLEPDALLRLLDTLNPAREPGPDDADQPLRPRQGRGRPAQAGPRGEARRPSGGVVAATRCTATSSRPTTATRRGRSTASWPKCAASSPCTAPRARIAGGIHVEMTGQDVTECTGGAVAITEQALADRYHTHCDPRLNAAQSLELAFLLAEMLNLEADRAAQARGLRRSAIGITA